MKFIGQPSPSSNVKKFLLIAPAGQQSLNVPQNVRLVFFRIEEVYLMTSKQLVHSSLVRKIGNNDSFVYSNEVRFIINGESIQKKK